MQIISQDIETKIQHKIVANTIQRKYAPATNHVLNVLEELYENIPKNKRISFGRVYTVQVLSRNSLSSLVETGSNVYELGTALFESGKDFRSKGITLDILSFYGVDDCKKVLPFFLKLQHRLMTGRCENSPRCFFRKLAKKWPDEMMEYLLKLTGSNDPNIRRFVSETLRPVKENRWFYKKPDYSLSILRNLFRESSEYPRTSVGNNLSDLARHLPNLVLELVGGLVADGDRNSYWIAYRACRNLVIKEPIRVMNLLHVDEYRYKNRVYRRSEHQRD